MTADKATIMTITESDTHAHGVYLTVRRPDGTVEEVDFRDKCISMGDRMFAAIRRNTQAAGRGDLLAVTKFVPIKIETRTAEEIEESRQDAAYYKANAWMHNHEVALYGRGGR